MSVEVKGVSQVVQDVKRLGEKATKVAANFRQSIEETDQALDMTQEMSDMLSVTTAELRGLLGISTNSPPPGERISEEPLDGEARGRLDASEEADAPDEADKDAQP